MLHQRSHRLVRRLLGHRQALSVVGKSCNNKCIDKVPSKYVANSAVQTAHFSCGSKTTQKETKLSAPKPVAENDFYFDEFKSFLALDLPSEEEKKIARGQLEDVLENQIRKEIMGIQATALTLVAQKLNDNPLILRVYQTLREKSVQPSPITLHVAAESCARMPNDSDTCEIVLDIVHQMHEAVYLMPPSESIYENAIETCVNDDQWIVALRLLNEMNQHNLAASEATWMSIAKCCLSSQEATAALSVVQLLLTADVDFDIDETMEQILLLSAETHNGQFALDMMALMHNHQMVQNGGRGTSWFGFRKSAHDQPLQLHGLSFDQRLQIVDALAADQRWIGLDQWLPSLGFIEYIRPQGEWKSNSTYMQVAIHIAAFLATHVTPSAKFCNALMLGYGRHGMLEQALELLQTHPRPDNTSYYAAITSCRQNADEALRLYSEASQRAQEPEHFHPKQNHTKLDLTNALLISLCKDEKYHQVLEIVSEMDPATRKNERTLNAVVTAHTSLKQWSEVIEIFKEIKVSGIDCSGYVYGSAIHAYVEMGMTPQALWLFNHIQNNDPAMMSHPAVLASVFHAFHVGEKPDDAMALFRSLDLNSESKALNIDGAVNLLRALARPRVNDQYEKNQSNITNSLEEVWSVLREIPSLFRSSKGPTSYVMDIALLVAADAHAIEMAEDIVTDGDEMRLPFSVSTYSHLMRVYSQPPMSFHGLDWDVRPSYPIRFHYWWDGLQENNLVPNHLTITSLLAAIRRGILTTMTPTDVLDAMDSTWNIPVAREHCELFLSLWAREIQQNGNEATTRRQVVSFLERMNQNDIYHSPWTIATAIKCLPENHDERNEMLEVLLEASIEDFTVADAILTNLEKSSDALFVLEKVSIISSSAISHAILTCAHDDSSLNLKRICLWIQENDVDLNISITTKGEVKKMLQEWNENPLNEPWRTVMFQGLV